MVSGLRAPLDLQSVPGDAERLYVVEQGGRIRVVRNGQIAGTFLDVAGRLSSGGERGLLGLAFHPQFATNRRFFVNYTNPAGDTHISEFRASSADAADPASERVLLEVGQPFANHNGGGLAFDNAGRLLIALGDGGSGGDPLNNGQKLGTLLGKILRIDVDAGSPYAVPADNPFRATAGARPEIWAYGLRNPFRIAIDRPTGDLYIGDVGQNAVEEIDVDPGSRRGGLNYGWRITEGSRCFNPSSGCDTSGITMPIYEYSHARGLLGDGRRRLPRLPRSRPGRHLLFRRLLLRVRAFAPIRERPGDGAPRLDLEPARPRFADLVRSRRRGRAVHRRPGRRDLPPRAELILFWGCCAAPPDPPFATRE